MAILFSISTCGFYDTSIHKKIPADAVTVSTEERDALIEDQSSGMSIALDAGGRPVAVNFSIEVTPQQARVKRNALLAASDWTQVADAPVDQAAWATYRQALRDITAQAGFPESIEWPAQPV